MKLINYGKLMKMIKPAGNSAQLSHATALLQQSGELRDAAVVVRHRAIVAYLVPKQITYSFKAWHELLATSLAPANLPVCYIVLDAIPRTKNADVVLADLPEADPETLGLCYFEPPRTTIEQIVAGHWQRLLGVNNVSRHSQFFELGGNSLLALQFIHQLRQELGLDLAVRDLLQQPQLSGFAELLSTRSQPEVKPEPTLLACSSLQFA